LIGDEASHAASGDHQPVLLKQHQRLADHRPGGPHRDSQFGLTLTQLGGPQLTNPREIVEGLRAAGISTVVMTVGSSGSLVAESDTVTTVASPRVKAIDTVGAGDAFAGALAARLAAGDRLLDAATYASRFAAYTVQFEGAQSSYPVPGTDLPT
jgi:ribokinase